MTAIATLCIPPLKKQSMAQLLAAAKRMGLSPQDYARQLVEDALSIQREAEKSSFHQILAPMRRGAGKVSDTQIVELIQKVRTKRRARNGHRNKD